MRPGGIQSITACILVCIPINLRFRRDANSIAWRRHEQLSFLLNVNSCFFQGRYLACLLWNGPPFSSVHLRLFVLSGAELCIISVKSHTNCLLCLKQSERNKHQQVGLIIFWWMVSNLHIYQCEKKYWLKTISSWAVCSTCLCQAELNKQMHESRRRQARDGVVWNDLVLLERHK